MLIKSTRTEGTCHEVDSVFKSLNVEKQIYSTVTESSVIKVRQDCAKFKGDISSHRAKWRLQVGADTNEVNGSSIKVGEEKVVEFQIAGQGKEECKGSVSGRPCGSGKIKRVASCW